MIRLETTRVGYTHKYIERVADQDYLLTHGRIALRLMHQ